MKLLVATTRSWAWPAAWHDRVMADEIVSHAFSHGFHPQHTERLAAYWAEALGGPDLVFGSLRRREYGRPDA